MEKRRVIEVMIPRPLSHWEPGDRIECGRDDDGERRVGTVLSVRGMPPGKVVLTVELDPAFDPLLGKEE